MEVLQLVLSRNFDEDDFNYDLTLSQLCSDLALQGKHDISLEGYLNLICGERGNPSLAIMQLLAVLQDYSVDPPECPPAAKTLASYLLLRIVPSSKECFVRDAKAILPTMLSGIHALIDTLGMAKYNGVQIIPLFAHGSAKPKGGGQYGYQPHSPDTKSDFYKCSLSYLERWYGADSSGLLYKLIRFMQPGQMVVAWGEVDEDGQPIPIRSGVRGKCAYVNACMTTQNDPNKARAEIVSKFPSYLRPRANNRNVLQCIPGCPHPCRDCKAFEHTDRTRSYQREATSEAQVRHHEISIILSGSSV